MKYILALIILISLSVGIYTGKAIYQVKLTPGSCLDAGTKSIGESIDNFISNIRG